jgi:hypothetical protein
MEYLENIYKKISKKQFALIFLVIVLLVFLNFFGLNPAKKMAEMRNAQRRADIASILNAVYQYRTDNNLTALEDIGETPKMICRSDAKNCENMLDLGKIIANKKYGLSAVPVDPKQKDLNASGYEISKLSNGRLNVFAVGAENNATIKLSK